MSKPTTVAREHPPAKKKDSSHGTEAMVRRLHTLAGVFVAPLVFVAALTGLFYAATPATEAWLYRDAMNATSGIPTQSLEAQIEVAQALHPDLTLSGVQVSDNPKSTTRVLFFEPALNSTSYKRAVFVDLGSLEVKGDLVQYGSSQALPLRTWISEGHRSLWMGELGRIYSEAAASWLGAITLAGAWIWWSRRRKRSTASRSRTPSPRTRLLDLHSKLGLWLLPGFVFLTVTGLTWSMIAGANIGELRAQLNWIEPKPAVTLSTAPPSTLDGAPTAAHAPDGGLHAHAGHEEHAGQQLATSQSNHAAVVDTVLTAGRRAGLNGLLDVTVPADSASAWVVKEARQPWRFSNDAVSVDGSTGRIVDKVLSSQWPMAAQLSNWLIQLHMGLLFGWINQLALAIIALGLLIIIVSGYRMWWLRGRSRKFGKLTPAGQWRKASPLSRAVIIVILFSYSLIAPLFGLSLLAFVLVDVAFRQARRLLKHRSIAFAMQ